MIGRTFSATLQGVDGVLVEIEASCRAALPKIQITGLPGDIVRESRERVKTCLGQLGYDVPSAHALVHLSPATAKKQGSQFDLPIAVSLLVAEGLLDSRKAGKTAFLGELRLDGRVEPVAGMLALLERLDKEPKVQTIVIPAESATEAALLGSHKVRLASRLGETLDFLNGRCELPTLAPASTAPPTAPDLSAFDDIIGQSIAKRALTIALAGEHHLLLVGPPGVGKSLLAQRIPRLLPPLAADEIVPVTKNYVFCGHERASPSTRPFRSPHHTISSSALLGGGSGVIVPGEVSLAHAGVLFLDEFPEFRKDALEGLREPMQSGEIHLHRVGQVISLPSRFTLVAAMNPCPCGYSLGGRGPADRCRCPRERVMAYRKRVSGPLLDRFDLGVLVSAPRAEDKPRVASAVDIVDKVRRARERKRRRVPMTMTDRISSLEPPSRDWLDRVIGEGRTSYRGLDKVLRVAETVADLEERDGVRLDDLREAWSYRCSETFWT